MILAVLLLACGGSAALDKADTPASGDSAQTPDSGDSGGRGDSGDSGDSGGRGDTSHLEETADTVEVEEIPGAGDGVTLSTEPVATDTPDVIVDCTGAGDYTTITAAVAASLSGTNIGLRPCTYEEDLNFLGKSLNIFGIDGSSVTTIKGTGTGAVITAVHGETDGTRLAGVTVTGGAIGIYGSGLTVDGSVLTLDDVLFTGNNHGYSVVYGTGVFLEFTDVRFVDNAVESGGMVLYLNNGSLLAQRMTMDCEDVSYGIYEHNVTMILDSDIDCGETIGIYVAGGELHIRRSTVRSPGVAVYGGDSDDTRNERMWVHNSAIVGGSVGLYAEYMHFKGRNDVFWGDDVGLELQSVHADSYLYNSGAYGETCGVLSDGETYTAGWNDVPNSARSCKADDFATLSDDPDFVSAPDDLHLNATSPLIDAGDPDKHRDDVDGSPNDIGLYGGPEGDGPP